MNNNKGRNNSTPYIVSYSSPPTYSRGGRLTSTRPTTFGFFEKSAVRVDLGGGEVCSEKNDKISPHTPLVDLLKALPRRHTRPPFRRRGLSYRSHSAPYSCCFLTVFFEFFDFFEHFRFFLCFYTPKYGYPTHHRFIWRTVEVISEPLRTLRASGASTAGRQPANV